MGRIQEMWFLAVFEKKDRVNMKNGIYRRSLEF